MKFSQKENLKNIVQCPFKSDVLLLADVFENFRKVCLETTHSTLLGTTQLLDSPTMPCWRLLKSDFICLPILTWLWWLRKESGKVSRWSLLDTLKLTTSTWGITIQRNQVRTFNTLMLTISTAGRWVSHCQRVALGGWLLNNWILGLITIHSRSRSRLPARTPRYSLWLPTSSQEAPSSQRSDRSQSGETNLKSSRQKKYVIQHQALKQCLKLGLKLTKIHRGIKFREEPFMKKYIDLNTKLRTKAKSEFEKDFSMLMNSSVFGKTM